MMTALSTAPLNPTHDSPMREALTLVAISGLGTAVCYAAGWVAGGSVTANAAAAGMLAAVAGGFAGWFAVTLLNRGQAPITAAPMLGMAVRLLVTAAGGGFAVMGAGLERKPVLFAALFGYLIMMAAESYFLYRFASRPRINPRNEPRSGDSASTDPREDQDR